MSVVKFDRKGLFAFLCAFSLVVVTGCSDDSDDDTPTDTTPPAISNLSHNDQEKVYGSRTITFSADIEDESTLTVTITHNGNPMTVTSSGNTYSASIILEDRDNNTIVLTADDGSPDTDPVSQTVDLDYPFLSFTNGQAASVLIGQSELTEGPNQNTGVAINTLSSPDDVSVIDGRLYIVDGNNHRISVFNTIPISDNADADFFIGQDSDTTNGPGTNDNQLFAPAAIANGDGHLLVGQDFSRVHYWTSTPAIANDVASYVIGQTGFITGSLSTCSQASLKGFVRGVEYVNEKIIVTNYGGNRVLIWNNVPAANGEAADMILGQEVYDSCDPNVVNTDVPTNKSMKSPSGVWSDGIRLVVADTENNRVLIWNSFPTTNYQAADLVLGQLTFDTAAPPSAMNAKEIAQPNGVYSNGNQLFVSTGAGRVLIWDSWPTENEQSANRVLGFQSLTSTTPLTGRARLYGPVGMDSYENKLILADTINQRVLIFQAP